MRATAQWLALALFLASASRGTANLVYGDDPRKPVEINDELLCESCHALLEQAERKLAGAKRDEAAVCTHGP